MTEAEANQKECPKRISSIKKYRSDLWDVEYAKCIDSKCMWGCDKAGNWLGHCGLISNT